MTPYKDIEPLALEKIPEIWDEYRRELSIYPQHGATSYEDKLTELYQMPEDDPRRLGGTIVFDNLVVPLIVQLSESGNNDRLEELFDWFEELASDENPEIRHGLLEVTLCESLLSNEVSHFHQLYPFLQSRPHLRLLFKGVSKRFTVSQAILDLLSFRGIWPAVLCLFICLLGCKNNVTYTQANIQAQAIGFPVSKGNITWLPDGRFLITGADVSASDTPGADEPTSYFLLDDGLLSRHTFPLDTNCTRYRYHLSGILPDGRLGLVKRCFIHDNLIQPPREELTYIMAYDWEQEALEQLVQESIPPFGAFHFSWNPDMQRGVQEAGSLLTTIFWLTPAGAEPMEVSIREGRRQWSLAEAYHAMVESAADKAPFGVVQQVDWEIADFGLVKQPVWSPAGTQIAFFASSDALGREGPSRLMSEYKLYLMDADALQPEPILDGIYYAHRLAWSPDGRWLALIAHANPSAPSTAILWLFSPADNQLISVTTDDIADFSWSPDGTALVAARACNPCEAAETVTLASGETVELSPCSITCREFVIYDVSSIVTTK